MKNLAQSIPLRYRQAVYSVLATVVGIEAIFDIVPDALEGKLLSALVVLGFGTALANTSGKSV